MTTDETTTDQRFVAAVRDAHRPSGRRLGIAVDPVVSPELRAEAARVLVASGVAPARRLATLRPRVGESLTRTADIAYFVRRFGHEYTVVVAGPTEDVEHRKLLEISCADAGCTLLVVDAPERP